MHHINFTSTRKLAVIGLGYVGLPLAVRASSQFSTIGYDINKARLSQLSDGIDATFEIEGDVLRAALAGQLKLTSTIEDCADAAAFLVTVPTPVDENNLPDLVPLEKACEAVAQVLSPGDLVVFESTVFPGCTEEVCVPILELGSGLTFNEHFFCGYSPERINPGDKKRTIDKIVKVTSGSTEHSALAIDNLYKQIIPAGTHRAPSIKVAEAAKVIENTQRDLNIALMNELSIIFDRLEIDTTEVLAAATTKWNFLSFTPGLVGGHCIGVDPYYLTYKSQQVGYEPQVILAGRNTNDSMASFVASKILDRVSGIPAPNILVLGVTFKEDCPDTRNSKVINLLIELSEGGAVLDVYDPWVPANEIHGIDTLQYLSSLDVKKKYHAVILAVSHSYFIEMGVANIRSFLLEKGVFFDLRSAFAKHESEYRM